MSLWQTGLGFSSGCALWDEACKDRLSTELELAQKEQALIEAQLNKDNSTDYTMYYVFAGIFLLIILAFVFYQIKIKKK